MVDWLVHWKGKGLVGHKVFCDYPPANRFILHKQSFQHPSQKNGILPTLIYRGYLIANDRNLPQEMEYLINICQQNG